MVSSIYLPGAAAEFPNDNPTLHLGVRWLCREPLGASRAVVHYRPGTIDLAAPAPAPQQSAPPPTKVRRCDGPLVLDLDRVVLLNRVEDVPPPPDFIFELFVPSARPATTAAPATALPALIPIPCRVIGGPPRTMDRRVSRRLRVDIAPCLSIGAPAPSEAPTLAIAPILASDAPAPSEAPALAIAPVLASEAPTPSEAPAKARAPAKAPSKATKPSRKAPAAASETRSKKKSARKRRRRGPIAARAIAPCPLPPEDAVTRAIAELEAAFEERAEKRSALAQSGLPG